MSQAGSWITSSSAINVEFLEGNTGGQVAPDGTQTIFVVGDTTTVNVVGNPATHTLTISATGAVPVTFDEDSGSATPALGVLNIHGDSHNITTSGAGNTVTVGLTGITQHSIQVGGASNALTQLGVATNGQLPIGSTGADPVLATLTAGTGISITNGAGSISIAATGTTNLNYTNVNTSPYVVLSTDEYLSVDCSGGAITLEFPNAATSGRAYIIKDRTGSAATHNITLTTVGGAVNIDGATTFVMNTAYESVNLMGNGTSMEVY